VLHDKAAEVDAALFLVSVELQFWDDRCHGHWSSSLEIEKPDSWRSGSWVMRICPVWHLIQVSSGG